MIPSPMNSNNEFDRRRLGVHRLPRSRASILSIIISPKTPRPRPTPLQTNTILMANPTHPLQNFLLTRHLLTSVLDIVIINRQRLSGTSITWHLPFLTLSQPNHPQPKCINVWKPGRLVRGNHTKWYSCLSWG
jgi:hypothetical protein